LFSNAETVYVSLDPGAEVEAARIGGMLKRGGINTRIVSVPTKPDDFFVLYGGDARQFSSYLEAGRVV
jgi:hypothetical protein